MCMWKRDPNIFGFIVFWGILLPALRGEHIFEKRTRNENLTIVLHNYVHQTYLPIFAMQVTLKTAVWGIWPINGK